MMKTEKITLENGWNPNFKPGTKVKAIATMWTISPGEVHEYKGGCDHPEHGWVVFLKTSELHIPGYVFEQGFERVLD